MYTRTRSPFLVAVLFWVGGSLSWVLSSWTDRIFASWLPFPIKAPLTTLTNLSMVPIPFALLSVALFLRSWRAAIAVPLNVVVWWCAYGLCGPPSSPWPIPPLFVAGAVGGLGVALSDSMCCPRLLSPKRLLYAALIGLGAAAPFFVLSLRAVIPRIGGPFLVILLALSTGVWQASVGSYLYLVCTDRDEQGSRVA
jgi:hypothetical protein